MNRRIFNPNFDINAKYREMINVSKRIVEHHEFISDGSCEPPMFVCLAYDVKNYLPKLFEENQKLKNSINKATEIIKNDRNYDDNDFEGRIFQKDILNALGVDYDEF